MTLWSGECVHFVVDYALDASTSPSLVVEQPIIGLVLPGDWEQQKAALAILDTLGDHGAVEDMRDETDYEISEESGEEGEEREVQRDPPLPPVVEQQSVCMWCERPLRGGGLASSSVRLVA